MKISRTPGQVAYEELFNSGKWFATIGHELAVYSSGKYDILPNEVFEKKISHYFNTFVTHENGKCSFAKPSCVQEALKFVKDLCQIDSSKVNPRGINLGNGYLSLSYNCQGDPVFELIEHNPQLIFTYKADFDYDPTISPKIAEKILLEILDKDDLEILLRNIASAFDLLQIRKQHARTIRALLLFNQGAGGKDTIRHLTSLIFGNEGLTSIPLQVFANADKERVFGLYPLAYSKINWSPENKAVKINDIQTLKQVITGDPIDIERKHQQPISIAPNTVCLFNCNSLPYIDSKSEAISSRYAIIQFHNVFKSNPDPRLPYEKLADPRLKEDEEYLKEEILPSYLNLLIEKYKLLIQEGIDYSAVDKRLDDVRQDSSHFYEFIQDNGLTMCDIQEGISAQQLYDSYYGPWCVKNQLIVQPVSFSSPIYNDPHPQYDRILRDYRSITKELKKYFPNLVIDKVRGQRRLSIKVTCFDI